MLLWHMLCTGFVWGNRCQKEGSWSMDTKNSLIINNSVDLGLVSDHRNLDKLRQLDGGSTEQKAQALVGAASQFESMLMKFWYDAMRQSNETLNPDSPLHSKYSGFFEDMLSAQHTSAAVNSNIKQLNPNSITYLITKQFAASLGDEGKKILTQIEQGQTKLVDPFTSNIKNASILDPMQTRYAQGYTQPNYFSKLYEANNKASIASLSKAYSDLPKITSLTKFEGPQDFVNKVMPYAVKATENTNMNPLVLVSQAALETGWGNHVPSNNNYYGIKASKSWKGESLAVSSAEFEDGKFVDKVSSFRAYPSIFESMKDYINLISTSDRYSKAAKLSYDPKQYFKEIQRAGYATDPNYADKLINISQQIAFMAYK